MTTKEYSVLTGRQMPDAEKELNSLYEQGLIDKQPSKNGILWRRKQSGR